MAPCVEGSDRVDEGNANRDGRSGQEVWRQSPKSPTTMSRRQLPKPTCPAAVLLCRMALSRVVVFSCGRASDTIHVSGRHRVTNMMGGFRKDVHQRRSRFRALQR